MGNFFMKKDQTGGRRMKIWQRPRLFTYFFAPFPYFCLFIFRCLYDTMKYRKYYEYDAPPHTGLDTGKCVEKAKFCQYQRLELRYVRLSAQSAMDEYDDWIWRANRLKLRADRFEKNHPIIDLKKIFQSSNLPQDHDAYDKWQKAIKKIVQLKEKHKNIRLHAHSLKKEHVKECKSKN